MESLIEEYKILHDTYRNNLEHAAVIARFYTATTLLILVGIFGKLTWTNDEYILTDTHKLYLAALVIILLIWSVQVLYMMMGIFRSRENLIIKINALRIKLFEKEDNDITSGYGTDEEIQKSTRTTYFAFAVYPIFVIVISASLVMDLLL